MAKKKIELESDKIQYSQCLQTARSAVAQGDYARAVETALSTWQYIDGMIQFENKYNEKEFASIESIEIVLQYAPPLLDHRSLDQIESLLKDQKRIERRTSDSLSTKLGTSRHLLSKAHKLWHTLESASSVNESELISRSKREAFYDRTILDHWYQMGFVRKAKINGADKVELTTQMGKRVYGKCSECGVVAKGAKRRFLLPNACPKCKANATFVILSRHLETEAKR